MDWTPEAQAAARERLAAAAAKPAGGKAKYALLTGLLMIVLFFGAMRVISNLLFGPDQTPAAAQASAPPAPAPTYPASINKAIQSVTIDGPWMDVKAKIGAVDEAAYVTEVAEVVEPFVKAFQKGQTGQTGQTGPVKTVVFSFYTDGIDRLGNKQPLLLMMLGYSAADLRAAHFENLGPYSILGLTNQVQMADKGAVDGVVKWCLENVDNAQAFCTAALPNK